MDFNKKYYGLEFAKLRKNKNINFTLVISSNKPFWYEITSVFIENLPGRLIHNKNDNTIYYERWDHPPFIIAKGHLLDTCLIYNFEKILLLQ